MKTNKFGLISIVLFVLSILISLLMSNIDFPLGGAILMEAFVSIHMSFFVLMPLSKMLANSDDNKLFWKMFWLRIAILAFNDLVITPAIATIDFFAVFIGAFLVVPITAKITNKTTALKSDEGLLKNITSIPNSSTTLNNGIILKCAKCGSDLHITHKFCQNCGEPFDGNNVTVSLANNANLSTQQVQSKVPILPSSFDSIYLLSEDKMVEEFINREMAKVGIDKNSPLIPEDILKRKKVLNVIFAVLIFIFISLTFFHFPIYTYIVGLIILFIFYKITRNYNLVKYLKKQLKARPGEKISNIVMNVKTTSITDNSKIIFIFSICLAIILPLLIFIKPIILYEKMDNGYGVRFYTFGLSNFTTATIPDTYKGEPVISLRGNTFSNMPFLKTVNLPDTITEIRGQAFKNDRNLTQVNIPSNLEYLGGGAFYNCSSLTSIEIPDTVTYIGGEAFYNASSLEHIRLSNNITEIRGNTFENCSSLKSISIPDSVTRIGGHAFYGCSSLNEVIFTQNSLLNEIGSSAFRQCDSLYSITLPINTYINERAFKESPTRINYFNNTSNNYYEY